MVEDILRVSDTVKVEVEDTNNLVQELWESSNVVYSSIEEITDRTSETVSSVQQQSKMTEKKEHEQNARAP